MHIWVLFFLGSAFERSSGPAVRVAVSVDPSDGANAILAHVPNAGSIIRLANLPTKILDFRGFDSSTILILRGEIPRSIGNFLESLSQTI